MQECDRPGDKECRHSFWPCVTDYILIWYSSSSSLKYIVIRLFSVRSVLLHFPCPSITTRLDTALNWRKKNENISQIGWSCLHFVKYAGIFNDFLCNVHMIYGFILIIFTLHYL